jgi:hypothetical protein
MNGSTETRVPKARFIGTNVTKEDVPKSAKAYEMDADIDEHTTYFGPPKETRRENETMPVSELVCFADYLRDPTLLTKKLGEQERYGVYKR